MCGSGVGHPYDPINGLKGGLSCKSLVGELPPSESLSCPPFGVYEHNLWVHKLVIWC